MFEPTGTAHGGTSAPAIEGDAALRSRRTDQSCHRSSVLEPAPCPHCGYGHTDRVRISPIRGCSFCCSFCNLSRYISYATKSVEALVDSVACAWRDEALPARHVLISGGTPRPEDHAYLREVLCPSREHIGGSTAIKAAFSGSQTEHPADIPRK